MLICFSVLLMRKFGEMIILVKVYKLYIYYIPTYDSKYTILFILFEVNENNIFVFNFVNKNW